jgi:hypothetical protein
MKHPLCVLSKSTPFTSPFPKDYSTHFFQKAFTCYLALLSLKREGHQDSYIHHQGMAGEVRHILLSSPQLWLWKSILLTLTLHIDLKPWAPCGAVRLSLYLTPVGPWVFLPYGRYLEFWVAAATWRQELAISVEAELELYIWLLWKELDLTGKDHWTPLYRLGGLSFQHRTWKQL